MPTYNEDPARVMAGLQAMHESLAAAGALDRFHIFILSDTTQPEAWIAEEAAYLALRERVTAQLGHPPRIFYRRRAKNIERKAGNIADWVRRWGAAYPQMLVLDADSVMESDIILRLAALKDDLPEVSELDVEPVHVSADGCWVLSARAKVTPSEDRRGEWYVRRLSQPAGAGDTLSG